MKSTAQSGHIYIITALISAVKPDMNPISLTTPKHVQFTALSVLCVYSVPLIKTPTHGLRERPPSGRSHGRFFPAGRRFNGAPLVQLTVHWFTLGAPGGVPPQRRTKGHRCTRCAVDETRPKAGARPTRPTPKSARKRAKTSPVGERKRPGDPRRIARRGRQSATSRQAEIKAESRKDLAGRRTQETPGSARTRAKTSPVGDRKTRRNPRRVARRCRRSATTTDAEIGAETREDIAGRRTLATPKSARTRAKTSRVGAGQRMQERPRSERTRTKRSPVGEHNRRRNRRGVTRRGRRSAKTKGLTSGGCPDQKRRGPSGRIRLRDPEFGIATSAPAVAEQPRHT